MTGSRRPHDDDVEAYLRALDRGDRRAALEVVTRLRDAGRPPLDILTRVVGPAQQRVGELWASDRWSVAQEHAATAVSEAVVHVLGAESPEPAPDAPQVTVACIEQEWHALPAMLVAEALRGEGFRVTYLGANASSEGLVRHVLDRGPRAVLLSCSLSASLVRARRHIEAVRETGTPVMVGGAAFDVEGRRARALGATAWARSGPAAARLIPALPSAVSPAEPLTHAGATEAALVYSDRESYAVAVSERLRRRLALDREPAWWRALGDQLSYLLGAVAGALLTRDPRLVDESLEWMALILDHRGATATVQPALREALREELSGLPHALAMLEGRSRVGPGG